MSQKNLSSPSSSQLASQAVSFKEVDFCDLISYCEATTHYHRGDILSGVLAGQANYEVARVYSDLSPGDDSEIEYDPEFDSRLDKFDAVEVGLRALNNMSNGNGSNIKSKDEEEK